MDEVKRIEFIFEKHIGLGIWWRSDFFTLELAICIPFVSIAFGFGRRK